MAQGNGTILAENAAKIAAGKEHGSGAPGSGNAGFLEVVQSNSGEGDHIVFAYRICGRSVTCPLIARTKAFISLRMTVAGA